MTAQLDATTTQSQQFLLGVRAMSPILLGMVPFALISGVTCAELGLSVGQTSGMALLIFAGAAQLATVQLLGLNAPALVIILTAVIINLRFAMYSASIAPYFERLPARWKAVLSAVLTDQAYAISVVHFQAPNSNKTWQHWFYLGGAVSLWATWQVGSVVGLLLGASLPATWGLDFAIPLVFMALLAPMVRNRPSVVALIVSGAVVLAAAPLPFNLSLIVAALAGIAAGTAAETLLERKKAQS